MREELDWQARLLELIARQEQPADLPALNPAGLAVYRNNYRVGLMESLALFYPVLGQIVGEDFFKGLAREYSKQVPSLSGNLHVYGGQFGDFIDAFPPAAELPYLGDVARVEWAVHRSYYAADAQPLPAVALAGVAPEDYDDLRFGFAPSCAVIASRWPVVAIWQGHQPGAALRVDLAAGGECALVHRQQGVVKVDVCSPGFAALLAALLAGQPLGEAAAAAMLAEEHLDLQSALLTLFQLGLPVSHSL